MTATADLSHMQDLAGIKRLSNGNDSTFQMSYNPERFGALIVRLKRPKTTVLVWSSGKVVCVGALEEMMARDAFQICARIIRDAGFNVKVRKFKVHNFVASWDMCTRIKLEDFARLNRMNSSYEPEIFPGCVYTVNGTKIMIFMSGKIFMTGIKNKSDIEKIFQHMIPKLKACLKTSGTEKSI